MPRWCNIIEEGPSENFFIAVSEVDGTNKNNKSSEGTEAPPIFNSINARGRVMDSDIERRGEIHVDDDNTPAPENIPSEESIVPEGARSNNSIFTAWGHDGVCLQRLQKVVTPMHKSSTLDPILVSLQFFRHLKYCFHRHFCNP